LVSRKQAKIKEEESELLTDFFFGYQTPNGVLGVCTVKKSLGNVFV
jgi:hypothetical protein